MVVLLSDARPEFWIVHPLHYTAVLGNFRSFQWIRIVNHFPGICHWLEQAEEVAQIVSALT
jgi:hypothetical protein